MNTPDELLKASLQIVAQLRDVQQDAPMVQQVDAAERDVAYRVLLGMVHGAVAEQCTRAGITFDQWVENALAAADELWNLEAGRQ